METQRLLLTVRDARSCLGNISHSRFYELIRDGQIRIVKIGRRTYITAAELARFVDSLTNGE